MRPACASSSEDQSPRAAKTLLRKRRKRRHHADSSAVSATVSFDLGYYRSRHLSPTSQHCCHSLSISIVCASVRATRTQPFLDLLTLVPSTARISAPTMVSRSQSKQANVQFGKTVAVFLTQLSQCAPITWWPSGKNIGNNRSRGRGRSYFGLG